MVVVRRSLPPPIVDWTEAAKRMFEAGDDERKRTAMDLGLMLEAVEELMVGSGFDAYRGLSFSSWPERNAEGIVVGIVRRYRDGAKKTMRGSHHGLYYGRHATVMAGPVYLPEGGSDTAALIGLGVNAIGRPSNTGGIVELGRILKGIQKAIVVLGERDNKPDSDCPTKCGWCMRCWPGLAGAIATATRLSKMLCRNVVVRMFPQAKDARAWVSENKQASAVEVLQVLDYDPVKEPCRVCGRNPPHEKRGREVICVQCRALLENLP